MSVLADWLARQAPAWLEGNHPLPPAQRQALLAIRRCRTPALGGHLYRCTACAETDFAYHSCHHRACPRCGGSRTAEWTQQQTERLLPVPYFLVTFTVPEEVRPIFAARPELLPDLFFAQAARALQSVADQPRHLGAELGMVGVLHTWGRQIQWHPHLHFIIPGGG
ncbi:MAG: transposase, partial [Acidobacteria bacterium]|nr:transposase [Acidobacteriota bacterium]